MKPIITTILSVCLAAMVWGQDIHSSHAHASPLLLNPAMTGLFQHDMRFIADFRSQWRSVTTNYQTAYGSLDLKTRRFLTVRDFAVGMGMEVFSDRAGDLDFRTYGSRATLSGIRTMGGKNNRKMITVGFKFGMMGNSVDYSKIVAFDEEPLINEGIANNRLYADWSVGMGWFQELRRKSRTGGARKRNTYYLGFSLNHINRPEVGFGLDGTNYNPEILYRRLIIHGGGDFSLGRDMSLLPTFSFADQGPHREVMMGTFWKHRGFNPGNNRDMALYLGAWTRWYAGMDVSGFDSMVGAIRLNYALTSLTLSYDFNLSSLAAASNGRGGFEVSVVQFVDWKGKRRTRVECPAFDY